MPKGLKSSLGCPPYPKICFFIAEMDRPTQMGSCRTNWWGRAPIGQSAEPIGSAECPKVRRTHWVLRRAQWARQNLLGLGKSDLAEPIGAPPNQWVRRNAVGFGGIDSFRQKNRRTRSCRTHWHDRRTNGFGRISMGSTGSHSVRQNLVCGPTFVPRPI